MKKELPEICTQCGCEMVGDDYRAECLCCGLIAVIKNGNVKTYYED
jgi:hypothetical protein